MWGLGIKCFLVATADSATLDFLEGWVPGHAALAPADVLPPVRLTLPMISKISGPCSFNT